jgi:hypothetical protein
MKHFIYLRSMILVSLIALLACGCSSVTITTGGSGSGGSTTSSSSTKDTGSSSGNTNSGSPSTAEPNWGVQTKTSGCRARGALEDPACTPGDIIKTATKAKICVSGYAGSVRNVPTSEKNQVYAEYGVKSHTTGQYEVDHHVSLELGGSNDISNLWPEAASPKPGFHEKDKVENYLHNQVCSGAISLKQAQIEIATNWLAVYNSMPSK